MTVTHNHFSCYLKTCACTFQALGAYNSTHWFKIKPFLFMHVFAANNWINKNPGFMLYPKLASCYKLYRID